MYNYMSGLNMHTVYTQASNNIIIVKPWTVLKILNIDMIMSIINFSWRHMLQSTIVFILGTLPHSQAPSDRL